MERDMKRPVGRPPTFNGRGGKSTTNVRLRLTRSQWQQIEDEAAAQGKSFREFLRQRLAASVKDVVDREGDQAVVRRSHPLLAKVLGGGPADLATAGGVTLDEI